MSSSIRLRRVIGPALLGLLMGFFGIHAEEPLLDPLPLKRVRLPMGRLPAEMKRIGDGVLVRMPREKFETLVQDAARGKRKAVPSLIEARYTARLLEGRALEGTTQWKIRHRGETPALLRLGSEGNSFNLAVKQPRYENRIALLSDFPDPSIAPSGRSLALLVDKPGEHMVTFDWSSRVEPHPEGLQIDLRLPACPAASLEIDVPMDRTVTAQEGVLVSGPHPADEANRRRWRIACGGKTHLPLLLHRGGGKSPPVILARQRNVQRVAPDGVEANFTFALELPQQDVSTLVFACEEGVRPVSVSAPELERWDVKSAGQGKGVEVEIQLSRPLRDGVVEIKALAPLASGNLRERSRGPLTVNWASPGIRLVNAAARGETIELWLHPQLRMNSWNPGDFRLTDLAGVEDTASKLTWRRLTLQGGGVGPQGDGKGSPPPPRRPSGLIQAGGVEYRVRQQNLWRLSTTTGSELTAQIDYEVRQGQLFQLELVIPPEHVVESVELNPPDLLRASGVRSGPMQNRILLVDLRRPLRVASTESSGTLTVRLRNTNTGISDREMVFPDVVPIGARYREGGLGIDIEEQIYAPALKTALATSEQIPGGPWGKDLPEFYYPFHGSTAVGKLQLKSRPARIRAQVFEDVSLLKDNPKLQVRLQLEAESGTPTWADVYVSHPHIKQWKWTSESRLSTIDQSLPSTTVGFGPRIRRVEPLHAQRVAADLCALGARHPLEALVLHAVRPPGTFWRLFFDRGLPPRRRVTFRAEQFLTPVEQQGPTLPRWEVPLVAVLGATRQEGEVTLHLNRANLGAVESIGLRETPVSQGTVSDQPTTWRRYRYTDPRAALLLQTLSNPSGQMTDVSLDNVRLTTLLTLQGEQRHHFSFRIARWPDLTLPIHLPDDAQLQMVGVDGKWIDRLPGVNKKGVVHLPVPMGRQTVSRVEIVYTRPGGEPSSVRWSISSVMPGLPIPPIRVERRWLLPPEMVPVGDTQVTAFPGGSGTKWKAFGANRFLDLFELGPKIPLPGQSPDSRFENLQALGDACASLREKQSGKSLTLEKCIEELSTGYLLEHQPLVMDHFALSRAGILPSTIVTLRQQASNSSLEEKQSPWLDPHLMIIPTKNALVVTTRTDFPCWTGSHSLPLSAETDRAIAQASRLGRDSSGRFLSAVEWLAPDCESRLPASLYPQRNGRSDGWVLWVQVPGSTDTDTLCVVHQGSLAACGVGVLAGLCLVFVLLRHRPMALRTVLLVTLTVSGLALTWLPAALVDLAWWPLLGCLGLAIPWYLRWATKSRRSGGGTSTFGGRESSLLSSGVSKIALGILVIALLWSQGWAQEAKVAPHVVYLLAGTKEEPESVLVAQSLVSRLEKMKLVPESDPARTGVVLVSGNYEGRLEKGYTEYTATFNVHALSEGSSLLELPLEGIQLVGDVLLDGARVLPEVLPAPRVGYVLRVKGVGQHKVELKFQVPLTGGLPESEKRPRPAPGRPGTPQPIVETSDLFRQVKFSVPKLVQSRLVFHAPRGTEYLQVPIKHCGLRMVKEGEGQKLEVELGTQIGQVILRWMDEASDPSKKGTQIRVGKAGPRVEFREAYLWDLQPDAGTLTGLIQYSITEGVLTQLSLELPEELEVRSARARRTRSPAGELGSEPPVRLSDWSITGKGKDRRLHLEFPYPVMGSVEVTLELIPVITWSGPVLLPLPRPVGEVSPSEKSYLAYRARGLKAQRVHWLRLTGIHPDKFAPYWPETTRPGPASLDSASTFIRDPVRPPELRVQLHPLLPAPEVRQNIRLKVPGYDRTEFQATLVLESPARDLSVLEWNTGSGQNLLITGVTGPGVSSWNQSGNRLIVWLESTTNLAKLELVGWIVPKPIPRKGKKSSAVASDQRLELPRLLPEFARSLETTVSLTPAPEFALTPVNLTNWQPQKAGGRELVYRSRSANTGGAFVIHKRPPPVVAMTTQMGIQKNELQFTTTINYRFQGNLPTVRVHLRDWDGKASLEGPKKVFAGSAKTSERTVGGRRERIWIQELTPGVSNQFQIQLKGSLPLTEMTTSIPMPDVFVMGVNQRTVKLEDSILVESSAGLRSLEQPGKPQSIVQVMQITSDDWYLRILPKPDRLPTQSVRVLLAEGQSLVGDGKRWLHEVRYLVQHQTPTELRFRWQRIPERVEMSVDRGPSSIVFPETGQVWLPLSGSGDLREVVVRYQYSQKEETLDEPLLTTPQIEGAQSISQLWTLHVPVGWESNSMRGGFRLVGQDDLHPGATRRAGIELYRASAYLNILQERIRKETTDEQSFLTLVAIRSQLKRSLWLAHLSLEAGGDADRRIGSEKRTYLSWWEELHKQSEALNRKRKKEDTTEDQPSLPDFLDTRAKGVAISWLVQPNETSPTVKLTSVARRDWRRAFTFTGQWMIFLVAIWTVTLSTVLRTLVRWLWPEQIVLLGVLGWHVVGASLIVVALLIFGVLGRLVLAGQGLRALIRTFTRTMSSTHSGT